MALIKKYGGRLLVLTTVGFAAFFAYQYFLGRSWVAETEYSRNRLKGVLNEVYYKDARQLEEAVRQNPSPENISRWRERTKLRQEQEQWMYETTSPADHSTTTLTRPTTANLEEFKVEELGDNAWNIQLDARQQWPDTGIPVEGGDEVEFIADKDSVACPGLPDPCAGPNGQMGLAKHSRFQPEQFPVGDAMFQALIARIGDQSGFQVGQYLKYKVPLNLSGTLRLMANIRLPYLHTASGGHRLIVKVSKSQ